MRKRPHRSGSPVEAHYLAPAALKMEGRPVVSPFATMRIAEAPAAVLIEEAPGKPGWRRLRLRADDGAGDPREMFADLPPDACGALARKLVDGDASRVAPAKGMALQPSPTD